MAYMATDGSTFKNKASGASLIFLEDDFKEFEFTPKHRAWKIEQCNNYLAEVSAIHKCVRTIPVTVPITIYTDSLSAIQAIHKCTRSPERRAPLTCTARPYITAIARAIKARDAYNAPTHIEHIHSHTGLRNLASIGNEAADREAKRIALTGPEIQPESNEHLGLLEHELQYVIHTKTDEETTDILHGNIRQEIKNILLDKQLAEWGKRNTRGKIARVHPKRVRRLIRNMWKHITTDKIQFLMETLNWVTPMEYDGPEGRRTKICDRCGLNAPDDPAHSLIHCPFVADLWNKADIDIEDILADDAEPLTSRFTQGTHYAHTQHANSQIAKRVRKITRGGINKAAHPPYEYTEHMCSLHAWAKIMQDVRTHEDLRTQEENAARALHIATKAHHKSTKSFHRALKRKERETHNRVWKTLAGPPLPTPAPVFQTYTT